MSENERELIRLIRDDPTLLAVALRLIAEAVKQNEAHERYLDRYEGFPHLYYKQEFSLVVDGNWITIPGAKTEGSVRDVPVMIPALRDAIEAAEKKSGKVLTTTQGLLRRECAAVCQAAGVPVITVHQLRHTFASLCAHLHIPMQISQMIGGWQTDSVMKSVYIHIAQSDYDSSIRAIKSFFGT